MTQPRILVAGLGNIFLGDDAFGVEVVRRLGAFGSAAGAGAGGGSGAGRPGGGASRRGPDSPVGGGTAATAEYRGARRMMNQQSISAERGYQEALEVLQGLAAAGSPQPEPAGQAPGT